MGLDDLAAFALEAGTLDGALARGAWSDDADTSDWSDGVRVRQKSRRESSLAPLGEEMGPVALPNGPH